MADRAKQLQMPEQADVEALLGFFRHFADEHHQTKEETILFPSLRVAGAEKSITPMRQMVFEHEQERSLIQALEDALRTKNHADFAYFGHRMADVLSNHIYKEDNILFQLAHKAIPKDKDITLVQEMADFDKSLRPGVYDDWMRTVNRLEWKYLNKVA
jgi:hemerythrin-like domain-containing protein